MVLVTVPVPKNTCGQIDNFKKIFFFFYRYQLSIEPKMAFGSFLGSSKWWYKFKYILLKFYFTCRDQTWQKESHKNCGKISGCCQLYEIHTFHSVSPPILVDLEILGWFKKRELREFITLGGDSKFKGKAVTLKNTMHLKNIASSLW